MLTRVTMSIAAELTQEYKTSDDCGGTQKALMHFDQRHMDNDEERRR